MYEKDVNMREKTGAFLCRIQTEEAFHSPGHKKKPVSEQSPLTGCLNMIRIDYRTPLEPKIISIV